MLLDKDSQQEIVVELLSRPGHEKVRTLVYRLLGDGLDASSEQVQFEKPLPEVRGRADALLGRTLLEFKRDLRAESPEAETQLARYIVQRQQDTGEHCIS